jgi:tripartite-type tricarboxylate transporter receptor subunit TctC
MRRSLIVLFLVSFVMCPFASAQAAQDVYPGKPIQIIVPFAAGGSLDLVTRVVAEKLRANLGQPVLVVNKPGAGTAVGAAFAATARPDGYTVYASSGATFGFLHALNASFAYGLKDFIPIAAVGSFPSVVVVHKDVPAKTLPELVSYAQKKPDALTFCSTGFGGLNHLELEMLKMSVKGGMEMQHVPHQGVAPALTALLGNQVQACTLPYSSLVKKNDGNAIRIIAVMRPKRLPSLPDTPTTGEQGFAEMDTNNYYLNYNLPAKTPAAIVTKLEAAFEKTMQDKEVRAKIEQMDTQPEFLGSKELGKWQEGQVKKFEQVIKKANISIK